MALSSMTCVTSSGRENLATLFRLLGVLQAPRELLFFKGSSCEFQASKRTRSKPDRIIVAWRGNAVKSLDAMRLRGIRGLGRVGSLLQCHLRAGPLQWPPVPKRPGANIGGLSGFAHADRKRARQRRSVVAATAAKLDTGIREPRDPSVMTSSPGSLASTNNGPPARIAKRVAELPSVERREFRGRRISASSRISTLPTPDKHSFSPWKSGCL